MEGTSNFGRKPGKGREGAKFSKILLEERITVSQKPAEVFPGTTVIMSQNDLK